jgi:hypothetical protein
MPLPIGCPNGGLAAAPPPPRRPVFETSNAYARGLPRGVRDYIRNSVIQTGRLYRAWM